MASQLIGTTETGWFNPGVNPPPFDMKLLLTKIYLAMDQAALPSQTPFDTCPTCEALARAVMMDQTGTA